MAIEKKTYVAESEAAFQSMATPQFNHDLMALIKSCQALIYITTYEENRFKAYMQHLSIAMKRKCFAWNVYKGLTNILDDKKEDSAGSDDNDPDVVLDMIIEKVDNPQKDDDSSKGTIYLLFGFDRFLRPGCDPETERRLKHLANSAGRVTIIFVGPSYATTESLDKDMSLLDFPHPNDDEIKNVLYQVLENTKSSLPNAAKRVKEQEEDLIKACRGLTLTEAQQAYSKSVVMTKKTKKPEFDIPSILGEKKQIIKKNPILDFVDTNLKISDVGGLDPMIDWLKKRKLAFQQDAAEYGLPCPKGMLMIGIPGCGKSLTAKAAASEYELPLLRLDFGKMFNSLVGESERTARDAIKLAESLAPCVSGDMVVYDSNGKSHTLEDLISSESETSSMYVYAINEETLRLERTKVRAVVKHKDKKRMLKIATPVGDIKVTLDHKLMVNRDGAVKWIEARKVAVGDMLMTPKFLRRDTKPFRFYDGVSMDRIVQYDELLIQKHRLDEGQDILPDAVYSEDMQEDIRLYNGFYTPDIYYILGMLDADGSVHSKNGAVFNSFNWGDKYHISRCIEDLFFIEPEISGSQVLIENQIACDLILAADERLIVQEEEILATYLSGLLDARGVITCHDLSRPKVVFNLASSQVKEKVKKVLLAFGILSFTETRDRIVLTSIIEIRKVLPLLTFNRLDLQHLAATLLTAGTCNKDNYNFGYRLGSRLLRDRNRIGIDAKKFEFSASTIGRYERQDSVVGLETALSISQTLTMAAPKGVESDIAKIVESDIVGVKVKSIEDIGEEWAYDLCCENNHNFFANNILCHNCILWCDEVEKGLSGSKSSGSTDGGTTSRVVSSFLTWLQEKTSPVFVICTANDANQIPPEFMRAGRFDEVFFVDLPSEKGREQIFDICIRRAKRNPQEFDLPALAKISTGYSGAEIEKSIEVALFEGFADGKRAITTNDVLQGIKSFKPLSETRKEEFEAMRAWADGRTVKANTANDPVTKIAPGSNKKNHPMKLDIE